MDMPTRPPVQTQEVFTQSGGAFSMQADANELGIDLTAHRNIAAQNHEGVRSRAGEIFKGTKKRAAIALVSGLAFIGAGGAIVACSDDGERVHPGDVAAATTEEINNVEICPAPEGKESGIFPYGAFEATDNSFGDELVVRPDSPLTNNKSLVEYAAGENGTMCNSAVDISATGAIIRDLGAGNFGVGFDTNDLNALTETYEANPEKALADIKVIKNYLALAKPNEQAITGPLFRVAKTSETSHVAEYVQEANVNIQAGEALVLSWTEVINDGNPANANQGQMLIYVPETGQKYTVKAVGAQIRQTEQSEEAGSEDQQNNQDNQGQNGQNADQSQGGGSSSNGESNNGVCPFCGGAGCEVCQGTGKGPGGGAEIGGECSGCGAPTTGGDCGNCGPTGGPTSTKPPKPTTSTTTPPTTPYTPPTTPYNPPTTTTRPTTTTTQPTTTTTEDNKGATPGRGGLPG